MSNPVKTLLFLVSFLCTFFWVQGEAEWTQWRGPNGDGHAQNGSYPIRWGEHQNIAWKTFLLPSKGHSSPVVQNGKIWLTSAVETPATKAEKEERVKESKFPGAAGLHYLSKVKFLAIQLDLITGNILKKVKVFEQRNPQAIHRLNSYASPSPLLVEGKLFVHFGTFGTACLNAETGHLIWKNQDPNLQIHHENGPGSTPIAWKDLLIFHLDGTDKQSVVALDQRTGKLIWQTERSGKLKENPQTKKAYATPMIAETEKGPLLISTGADWIYGYAPHNGKELWKINYGILGFSNVAKPIIHKDLLIISTGFMKGELHAYKLDGLNQPKLVWKLSKGAPKKPSPILVNELVYVINDGGILTVVNLYDGSLIWRERLEGEYSASPTYAGGHIYFSNQSGKTTVIKPGNQLEIVEENQLRTGHMASFAPIPKGLVVRTNEALYRIEEQDP
jgi:outer membrane protein assembly factor BamB